jgi:hypothetical protein
MDKKETIDLWFLLSAAFLIFCALIYFTYGHITMLAFSAGYGVNTAFRILTE